MKKMNNEERFGKTLLVSVASKGRGLRKRVLYLIAAFVFVAAGIVLTLNPELGVVVEEDAHLVPVFIAIFIAVGLIFVILSLVRSKQSSITLYEQGIMYAHGKKVTEAGFSDLEGIRLETSAVAIGGVAIPLGSLGQESVTIRMKDGTVVVLRKSTISNFRDFADKFGVVYTRWLLDGLTLDNISDAEISFGPDLKLRSGQFIYIEKKQEKTMPLSDIHSLEIETGDEYNYFWLTSKTLTNKNGTPKKVIGGQTAMALNLEALHIIVQMILGNE